MSFREVDEERIQAPGKECFQEIQDQKLSLMGPKAYTGKLMNLAMEDPGFRVALFRLVDVLPSLQDSAPVIRRQRRHTSARRPTVCRVCGNGAWTLLRASGTLRANTDLIRPAFASHNLRSLMHSIAFAGQWEVPREQYEFQTLHGMAAPTAEN